MRFATAVTFLALLLLPVTAAAQTDAGQVAFGARHAIAVRTNGEVVTWGNNVGCQLGRRTGNRSVEPGLVLRNGVQVAAAADHSMALTRDGHVYGWGVNGEGQLGVGTEFDQCEGPVLIESLEGKGIVQIATGQDFSVALSGTGQLYCAGATDMGQCPAVKGVPNQVFRPVSIPDGVGPLVAIKAGAYHTLALTKDGRLFAFGRGRDGQLGNGRVLNGAGVVEGLTGVVSFGAGIWHSAAVTRRAAVAGGAGRPDRRGQEGAREPGRPVSRPVTRGRAADRCVDPADPRPGAAGASRSREEEYGRSDAPAGRSERARAEDAGDPASASGARRAHDH